MIELYNPDIIIGCESKLDPTIPSYSIFPASYATNRLDRSQHKGGVFIDVFTEENFDVPPSLPSHALPPIDEIQLSVERVKDQLRKINPNKATGPDGIVSKVLKDNANSIALMLTSVVQQSLDTATVPSAWKEANINGIYKKGDKFRPANCRPVSLTCVCSKLLEHIIDSTIRKHLSRHTALNPHQHGFRKGLSCETQLTSTVHEWARNLDQHGQTDIIFLDFTKAFDSVPHQKLLTKIKQYGIIGNLHHWM